MEALCAATTEKARVDATQKFITVFPMGKKTFDLCTLDAKVEKPVNVRSTHDSNHDPLFLSNPFHRTMVETYIEQRVASKGLRCELGLFTRDDTRTVIRMKTKDYGVAPLVLAAVLEVGCGTTLCADGNVYVSPRNFKVLQYDYEHGISDLFLERRILDKMRDYVSSDPDEIEDRISYLRNTHWYVRTEEAWISHEGKDFVKLLRNYVNGAQEQDDAQHRQWRTCALKARNSIGEPQLIQNIFYVRSYSDNRDGHAICMVCHAKRASRLVVPCSHVALCSKCGEKVNDSIGLFFSCVLCDVLVRQASKKAYKQLLQLGK